MTLKQRVDAFIALGRKIKGIFEEHQPLDEQQLALKEGIEKAGSANPWFIPKFTTAALVEISNMLEAESLQSWVKNYPSLRAEEALKRVGVIMAGNIPAVGFHDFLTVLISGNRIVAKPASDDHVLLALIAGILIQLEPQFSERIEFTRDKFTGIDAIIATGSTNTSRYFEFYFSKYPNIIRKSRTSAAVLTGEETAEQLEELSNDLFMYFGLGCRNVSKLFVPLGYDPVALLNACKSWETLLLNNSRYFNNYEYNKAIFLINREPHFDTGFVLLKESTTATSPIGVIHFETYSDKTVLNHKINMLGESLQCLVSNVPQNQRAVGFGKSQRPHLEDYADGVDTLAFLSNLN